MFYWKKLLSKRQMICTRLQGLSRGRLRGWEILTHLLFVFHRSQMKLTLKWGEHLTLTLWSPLNLGFPVGSVVKNLLADAGDVGLITGLERSPGGGNGKPLQYSCLENPWMEEPGGLHTVHGFVRNLTTEGLSMHAPPHFVHSLTTPSFLPQLTHTLTTQYYFPLQTKIADCLRVFTVRSPVSWTCCPSFSRSSTFGARHYKMLASLFTILQPSKAAHVCG